MKVLIVAKTRQGQGACIGGISQEGKSVRLVDAAREERWGLAFEVGDVWEVSGTPPALVPPHVENIAVSSRRQLKRGIDPLATIHKYMPPVSGGIDALYEGMTAPRESGALTITRAGIPRFSTQFWRPDKPLARDTAGKRIRYVYESEAGPRSLAFVGFQEPLEEIPAGALLRVSLSHWWKPEDRPFDEPRCWVQLSGWFVDQRPPVRLAGRARPPGRIAEARRTLEEVFGYREFRPLQEEIITRVLAGQDALGIMPTGAGKSLCFQLPALLIDGLTVVVSPLLSLMQDQVAQLRAAGVSAVSLNSMLSYQEYVRGQDRVRSGQAKLLYVAPETLLRPEVLTLLEESRLGLFTIDEAHCISDWGHDFRPEYRQLKAVRDRFPSASCLALTATATERVRQDIRCQLGIPEDGVFVAGFDRPNLFLAARRRQSDLRQILEFLAGHRGQSGIIYCATRDQVDSLVSTLKSHGVDALPYHAGLSEEERKRNQREFQHDRVEIIVATIAFGMGINKSNVRFILHCALPSSVETYYQQVGRAGRDGLPADCLLLYSRADMHTAFHFIEEGSEAEKQGRSARLLAMMRLAESTGCRRRILLPYFGDPEPQESCSVCDNCSAERDGRKPTDVSEDARTFLRCVKGTGQKFGIGHIVEVLRGSRAERVIRWRHDQLSVHGEGRHLPAELWKLLADRFIESGLLTVEMEHGTVQLTPKGVGVLNGEQVSVFLEETPRNVPEEKVEYDARLFEILRGLRRELAGEEEVPPFVIFSDRSLTEMAAYFPQSIESFLNINGVGRRKAEAYGKRFVQAIKEYAVERGLPEKAPPAARRSRKTESEHRFNQVGKAYHEGASIADLQERWGVTAGTILQHLQRYVLAGNRLDAGRLLRESLLRPDLITRAMTLFEEHGDQRLGPVFEEMAGEVSYNDLHLLRLVRICARPTGRLEIAADTNENPGRKDDPA